MTQETRDKAIFMAILMAEEKEVALMRSALSDREKKLGYLQSIQHHFKLNEPQLEFENKEKTEEKVPDRSQRGGKPVSPTWTRIMRFVSESGIVTPLDVIRFVHDVGLEVKPDQIKWQLKEYARKGWLVLIGGGYRITELGRQKFGLPTKNEGPQKGGPHSGGVFD